MTVELDATVQSLATMPMSTRLQLAKNLGEVMVMAHGVTQAEAGRSVSILIDDTEGARLASNEVARLDRRRSRHRRGPAQTLKHMCHPHPGCWPPVHSGSQHHAQALRAAARV